MEIVKKNILSIICGVVALVAVAALFWPIGGMYEVSQNELVARKKVFDDLKSMHTARRNWPVMPEVGTTVQASLPQFPSQAHIDEGKAIEEKVQKQAAKMKELTAENNIHQPLMPDVLPIPGEQRFRFATEYGKAAAAMPVDLAWTEAPAKDAKDSPVAMPPSDQDVVDEANNIWNATYDPKIIRVAGKEVNRDQVVADWQDEVGKLQLKMRNLRAQKLKMYVDRDAISVSHSMVPPPPGGPKEKEIWYAQSSLWVQQDIAAALKAIDADAKDVTESPVKHLLSLRVPDDQSQYLTSGGGGSSQMGMSSAAPESGFTRSITGRLSNPLYDVIKFDLVINVEASKIPAIIADLQKGRLITVDSVNATAVDGVAASDAGFIYGNVPVVKLTIQGEDLFLRDWTVKLMPASVKTDLNITATASAVP